LLLVDYLVEPEALLIDPLLDLLKAFFAVDALAFDDLLQLREVVFKALLQMLNALESVFAFLCDVILKS